MTTLIRAEYKQVYQMVEGRKRNFGEKTERIKITAIRCMTKKSSDPEENCSWFAIIGEL